MRITAKALTLGALLSVPVLSHTGQSAGSVPEWAAMTAGQLREICTSPSEVHQETCRHFFSGLVSTNVADRTGVYALLDGITSGYVDKSEREGATQVEVNGFRDRITGFRALVGNTVFFCLPAKTTYNQVKSGMLEHLMKHPGARDGMASRVVTKILVDAHPCG